MSPFFSGGNHFTAAGVAAAYPRPNPVPARSPNPTIAGQTIAGEAKLATTRPTPVRTPPTLATTRGPTLSWSRPAGDHHQGEAGDRDRVRQRRLRLRPAEAAAARTVSASCLENTLHA